MNSNLLALTLCAGLLCSTMVDADDRDSRRHGRWKEHRDSRHHDDADDVRSWPHRRSGNGHRFAREYDDRYRQSWFIDTPVVTIYRYVPRSNFYGRVYWYDRDHYSGDHDHCDHW